MELSMKPNPRANEEGFLYSYDPMDVPEGATKVRFTRGPVTFYCVADGPDLVEVFAVHNKWGPSDSHRGVSHAGVHGPDAGPLSHITDRLWRREVDGL